MKLKSIEIIRGDTRVSSVDVFRAFAILAVVIFHFNTFLPHGELGVDLFFVISGLLVGGILIRKFRSNERISFWRFILQRGFKIWPSYYWFLLFGNLLAWLFLNNARPEDIIGGGKDAMRFVFFYQNYAGSPLHWPFDHIWSLCVEEHFYIILPVVFIVTGWFLGKSLKSLFLIVTGLIAAGMIFKLLSIYFAPGQDTNATTHSRIDAFGWGLLLGLLVIFFENYLRKIKWLPLLSVAGILLLATDILVLNYWKNYFFEKIIFHSIAPFSLFLIILGLYYHDFSKWKPLRFIAYYSYNWYLWHPLFVWIITQYAGITLFGLLIYMIVSFLVAMLFTILVEEKFLSIREATLNKIFRKKVYANV